MHHLKRGELDLVERRSKEISFEMPLEKFFLLINHKEVSHYENIACKQMQVNLALHLSRVTKSSTSFSWGKVALPGGR